jgi:hypothetical protein
VSQRLWSMEDLVALIAEREDTKAGARLVG